MPLGNWFSAITPDTHVKGYKDYLQLHFSWIFCLAIQYNKAIYTASSVACFWAGAVTFLFTSRAKTVFFYQFGMFLF